MLKQRKMIFTVFIFYTLLILYFMLFGFDRYDAAARTDGYTFIFVPDGFFEMPALSELLHPTLMDLVSIGNIAAFIPFGLLVPLLYRMSFVRFLALFILSILVIETVQAVTMLGSFDVNDVFKNSVGAAIGYGAYKLGIRGKSVPKQSVLTVFFAVIFLGGTMMVFGGIEKAFTKEQGPFTALNIWKDDRENPAKENSKPYSFTIGGREVEPRFNLYDADGQKTKTYTYDLNHKDLFLYLNYGISDQSEFRGSLSVSVDGQQVLVVSSQEQEQAPADFKWFFEQAGELTITIEGNEKVWDVGYQEMQYFWE